MPPSQTTYDRTTATSWQLNADDDGPKINDEGSGIMGVRTSADALAKLRAADPAGDNDVATKGYGDANWGAGAGADVQDVEFTAMGPYRVDTQVDGRHYNRTGRTLTIEDVTMHRETAGVSGSTTIDINIDGTTIYTTQANRPTVAYTEGDDAVDQGGTPDVTSWPNNSYVSFDIDAVEGGGRANLRVVVTAS